jgi:fatty acyl-CoA reductase
VLLTGATGFVGKCVLEKLIRSLEFKKIFLLVRPKTSVTVQERINQEVFTSELFETVFNTNPSASEIIERVKPVAGDLLLDNLGLSEEDRTMLTDQVNIIIHCAANLNYNDHLSDALRINYFGPLKMLELAQECHNLQSFTMMSTAYVNSNRPQFIEEKIYDLPSNQDVE